MNSAYGLLKGKKQYKGGGEVAEVSIDIAKETSVEAVKGDTAAIKTDVTAVKDDVSTVKTNVLTVKTNVANIKSKTDLIGATGDTGGSATAGTVMGKLNAIITNLGAIENGSY